MTFSNCNLTKLFAKITSWLFVQSENKTRAVICSSKHRLFTEARSHRLQGPVVFNLKLAWLTEQRDQLRSALQCFAQKGSCVGKNNFVTFLGEKNNVTKNLQGQI